MRLSISVCAALVGLLSVCSAPAAQLAAGTQLQVRLRTAVSSATSQNGQAVEAVVIVPVLEGTQILVPAGAVVRGKVSQVLASSKAKDSFGEVGKGRAELLLNFNELSWQKQTSKMESLVERVDNARESVDPKGKITGILASETLGSRLDQGLGKLAEKNAGLGGLLATIKGTLLGDVDPEIKYDPGVELVVQLTKPLNWQPPADQAAAGPKLEPIQDERAIAELANQQPFQTVAENPPKPSDITNLMFIGTAEQLEAAFKEAGWTGADVISGRSVLETVAAVAESRGYKQAPMSVLLLDGHRAAYDFQKQHNTFAMRHHLRIFKRPDLFQGKPVWVSSSTHDTGIEFSQENRTFIHKIDSNIDKERAKVVTDMLFTGKVRSLLLADRPEVPRTTRNATGDTIETDGRMAVIVF